jgi:hypothetical protein
MRRDPENNETIAATGKSMPHKDRKSLLIRYHLVAWQDGHSGILVLATIEDDLDGQSYGGSGVFRAGLENQIGKRNIK